MKHLSAIRRGLLLACWGLVLGTQLAFCALMPISQHLHSLYAPMVRLFLGLYLLSLFLVPILFLAGLLITLHQRAWRAAAWSLLLIPLWFFMIHTVGSAV